MIECYKHRNQPHTQNHNMLLALYILRKQWKSQRKSKKTSFSTEKRFFSNEQVPNSSACFSSLLFPNHLTQSFSISSYFMSDCPSCNLALLSCHSFHHPLLLRCVTMSSCFDPFIRADRWYDRKWVSSYTRHTATFQTRLCRKTNCRSFYQATLNKGVWTQVQMLQTDQFQQFIYKRRIHRQARDNTRNSLKQITTHHNNVKANS